MGSGVAVVVDRLIIRRAAASAAGGGGGGGGRIVDMMSPGDTSRTTRLSDPREDVVEDVGCVNGILLEAAHFGPYGAGSAEGCYPAVLFCVAARGGNDRCSIVSQPCSHQS